MCRLLGAVTTSTRSPRDILGGDLESFRAMSEEHCDGWGAAYWTDQDNLRCQKTTEPALSSPAFDRLCDSARTDAVMLHLRMASPGMSNLPENTHPFLAGSIAFAHNGYAWPNAALDRLLEEVGVQPAVGGTDSERYFRLILALMREMDIVEALDRATSMIAERTEYQSLNCLMLTHDALYALECWDPAVTAAQGKDPDTYSLHYKAGEQSVVVASSGWQQPQPQWDAVSNGRVLEVLRGSLRTRVHRLRNSHRSAA